MSTQVVLPVATPKLNAIQVLEQKIVEYGKQHIQAIANVHAVEGAIQGAQDILRALKAEEAKAAVEVEKVAGEVKTEVTNVVEFVEKKL